MMHCTGIGKAFLAFLSEEEIDRIISKAGLPGFTESTITERAKLIDELREIRVNGYAIDNEEHKENTFCIGAEEVGLVHVGVGNSECLFVKCVI